ncbi:VOC family protein [Neptuniibacter sp. QD37_6]|uniref:VOC family protein n=1 Tax=Neptuniibacter sp. QD37_6 TaxID=3398210 RepID=UPI0039F50CD9
MNIERLDHLVLTVKDINITVEFYTAVLGMEKVVFKGGRIALVFGQQKINLHQLGNEFEPKADQVQPGSADLCFIVEQPIEEVIQHLLDHNVTLLEGPVNRTGALGKIVSVYLRDPDGNLIELSNYVDACVTS